VSMFIQIFLFHLLPTLVSAAHFDIPTSFVKLVVGLRVAQFSDPWASTFVISAMDFELIDFAINCFIWNVLEILPFGAAVGAILSLVFIEPVL